MNMNFDAIFFIGPQGSGKGTQARVLADRTGFYHWENGAILRAIATEPTELGSQVKELLEAGQLLPDELLYEVVKSKLDSLPAGQGIIFDGLPRRVSQAEFLLPYLKEKSLARFATVFIDLPEQESIQRLLLRAQKEGRADDTEDKILYRLQQYKESTVPVLDYLRHHSTFITVDGTPPVEMVTEQITNALNIPHEVTS